MAPASMEMQDIAPESSRGGVLGLVPLESRLSRFLRFLLAVLGFGGVTSSLCAGILSPVHDSSSDSVSE